MKVSVILEQRYLRLPDGSVWTPGPFARAFFDRYLTVFEEVEVIARVREVNELPPSAQRLDGPGVSVRPLVHYVGPAEYCFRRTQLRHGLRTAFADAQAVILRVPSQLANLVEPMLRREGLPFALEVVGDPADAFAPDANAHPLRRWFRTEHTRRLRMQCRRARFVSYVTANALQRRYPAAPDATVTHYSSVELPSEAFQLREQSVIPRERHRLTTVGSLDHCYKGVDTLIEAVARLGTRFELTVVGDGRERAGLERLAREQRVEARFVGRLASGAAVREELDRADTFVLASRQEGLPRALVEAMARGLPCIATDVGGCAELLDRSCLVAPNDSRALADAIQGLVSDTERAVRLARENYTRSRCYADLELQPRRDRFFRGLRQAAIRAGTADQLSGPAITAEKPTYV